MVRPTEQIVSRLKVAENSLLGRKTSGVKIINNEIESGVAVASIGKVRESESEVQEEIRETQQIENK